MRKQSPWSGQAYAVFLPVLHCHAGVLMSLLFERDTPPPEGDADQAFFTWERRDACNSAIPMPF